ncbi:MAG: Maf family protein [Verrucomicrobiales bacterium]|nr:Maf family protein [Verrucomicrobiales bacterium]
MSARRKMPMLILASASPRRAELLRHLGLRFRIVPSHADETADAHLSPRELCRLNAYRKARVVAERHPDALVLGADTLVFLGRRMFGKPSSLREAEQMLLALQGRTHHVVTGVALLEWRARWERVFAVTTAVRFRRLTRAQVRRYLGAVNPLDKAGAYAIQEHGEWLVEEVVGSFTNVVGLPLERVEAELRGWFAPGRAARPTRAG